MNEFPRGTVTFLATDIQGSTEIWERYPDAMPRALERHEQLLREAVETLSLREIVDVVCEPPHRPQDDSTRTSMLIVRFAMPATVRG